MKFSQSAIIKPQFFNFICAYVLNIETSLTSFSFDRQLPSLTWASENKTLASKKRNKALEEKKRTMSKFLLDWNRNPSIHSFFEILTRNKQRKSFRFDSREEKAENLFYELGTKHINEL